MAVAVIAVVIVGAVWILPSLLSHGLAGTITVSDTSSFGSSSVLTTGAAGSSCFTSGGYSDIQFGAAVTVRDGTGRIIATGQLLFGETVSPNRCRFAFSIPSVPRSDFYSIEVSHRGALTYSAQDLDAEGWLVQLTLGD